MKPTSWMTLALAVAVLPACKDKPADKEAPKTTGSGAASGSGSGSGSAAPTTPPPPTGDGKPFEAMLEGKPYKFVSATINSATQSDSITLSTAAGGCDTEYNEGDIELSVSVESGPGGKHFAPGPLAVAVNLTSEKESFAISSGLFHGVLTLEPGGAEWKEGGKVKGTLRIDEVDTGDDGVKKTYTGSGSFEAEICGLADSDRYQATPEAADKGPASGTLGSMKFAFKSGIAVLSHDDDRNEDRIGEISLFDAAVDCATWKNHEGPRVVLNGDGGAKGKDVFIGAPQTTTIYYHPSPGQQEQIVGPSWVEYDALELKEGTEVKGSVHGEGATSKVKEDPKYAAKISGAFTAKVCKE